MSDNDPNTSAAVWTAGLNTDVRAGLFLSNQIVALLAATACFALRIYVRASLVKLIGADDWILVAAYVFFAIQVLIQVVYAANIAAHDLDSQYVVSLQLIVFWGLAYSFTLALVRGAIAAFFLRLIKDHDYTWQKWTIKITYGLYATYTIVYGFVNFFACGNPLDVTNPDVVCLNLDALDKLALTGTILNMLIDWTLTVVPAVIILRSHLSRRDKISTVIVVAFGGAGGIISVVRIPYIGLGSFTGVDQFPNLSIYLVLALWENTIGVMAISLAATKPLLKRYLPDTTNDASSANTEVLPSFVDAAALNAQGSKGSDKKDGGQGLVCMVGVYHGAA